jgi:hypothetical protein
MKPTVIFLVILLAANAVVAADGPIDEHVRPFLRKHCLECHGADKPKGKLRLDSLTADFNSAETKDRWRAVLDRLKAGEMPPKDKPRPPIADVQRLTKWIGGQMESADAARREQGRAVLRRLNRVEYENTIRDLLGIHVELQELLPADTAAHGFDNVGEALHTSSFLMEKYLEAADIALGKAIANGPKPPLVKKRYFMKDERYVKTTTESVFRHIEDNTLVMFSSSAWNAITVGQFYPPDRGTYRFRLCLSAFQSKDKPVTLRVDAGPMLMGTKNHLVGYFDIPAGKPTIIEFTDQLEARSHIRILPYGLATAQTVNKIGADKYEGPGLAVHWIEAEGPLNDRWPPDSHRRIFGDMPQGPAPIYNARNRVEVVSKDPEADARRILLSFARRAFRRTVTEDEIKPFAALVKTKLAGKYSFEQSVRVGLTAILVSPEFLFLREKPGKLDDFALASRLSYFLWSTMPDEELLALAENKKLGEPATRWAQAERLLNSSRAAAFTENFVGQWLALRDIDFTEPSHILYPEFDHMLKVSMVKETELFFTELLKNDLSLSNFVASDFSMLNGRLARHYGISGVEGYEFRKVKLPPESHRGGVLTMASVLKVTANGTSTSPVMRGAWILDRILGTPPPKPPADVPALEPDIRGATTIREQLARHRQVASCASCHEKIDPPGFALESFDVIGGWREHYRTTGSGQTVIVDGRRMPYHKGKPVDPSDTMPDGQKFKNIDELKQILLKDKDQLARALTQKLVTYATGAAPGPDDAKEIEAIVRAVREKGFGLRSLVHEVVACGMFRGK